MSEAKKGQPRTEGAGKASQQIEVTDIKNNITTSYDSINKAAEALNIYIVESLIILNKIKRNRIKVKYTFYKIKLVRAPAKQPFLFQLFTKKVLNIEF